MKNLFLAAGAALVLASSSTLTLADTTWTSTAQNLWANSVDWSTGLPNGSSGAIFQDPGTVGLVHAIDVSVQNTITRGISLRLSEKIRGSSETEEPSTFSSLESFFLLHKVLDSSDLQMI